MAERLVSYDPRNLQPVGDVETTSPGEIQGIVERSRKAFRTWSALGFDERKQHLLTFKRTILARGEEVAEMVSRETGKPTSDAYPFDVLTSLNLIDHYARNARKYLKPRKAGTWPYVSTQGWVQYEPRGVAGVISPWNYPFFLSIIPTVSALAAGCSVILKPSERTPLTGQLLGELAEEAGLPTDLIQVVQGGGEVGAALVDHVDIIAFTGSSAVGRKVAEAAARRLIPAVLELGGKDPLIVLEDADLRQAARAAVWGGMVNAGQTCTSTERIYVVDAVHDEFMVELDKALEGVSAATGDRKDIGPLIDDRQYEHVRRQIDEAVAAGARLLRGGRTLEGPGGHYIEPTVLTDVDNSMPIMQDETFGPVIAVTRVPDEDTAVELANDTRYGLHATVWSKNRARAARIASRLRSGTVAINDTAVNFVMTTMPFGGVGESGLGSAFGEEGIRSYCIAKGITRARTPLPTTALLGVRFPRRRGMAYWKGLARALFRW